MLGLTEQSGAIMRTVDKLDKIGAEKVRALLLDDCGITEEQAAEILKFIAITGSNSDVLAALAGYGGRNELFDQGLVGAEHRGAVSGGLRRAGGKLRRGSHHRPRSGLLHRHRVRDHAAGSSGDRLRVLRRTVRQSGGILHRPAAARRGHLHRPDAAVLCAGRAGDAESRAAHRPGGRAGAAHDGGSGAGHHAVHPAAGSRGAHPALHASRRSSRQR